MRTKIKEEAHPSLRLDDGSAMITYSVLIREKPTDKRFKLYTYAYTEQAALEALKLAERFGGKE